MARRRAKTVEEQSEETLNRGIKIIESYKLKVNEERQKRLNINTKKEVSSAKKTFRFCFVILLIILIAVVVNYGPILGLKLVNIEADNIIIDNILSSESQYTEYNNELLIYTDGKVSTYNHSGNITWEYVFEESFIPSIYTKEKYMVIVNKTNGMIYYFSNKKEIANQVIDGDIENIYIAEDGRFVVQYTKDSGYKKVISMYNGKCKLQYQEAYINSSPIIGIEFLNDKDKLLVVQANSSFINIGTDFCILDYSNNGTLTNVCELKDSLVYNYKLINDEVIYITNESVESFNISSKSKNKIHSLDSGQTNFISLYNNYFITVEMADGGYKFSSKKFDNTIISTVLLSAFPKYVEMSGILTYIVSENEICVINKWGMIVSNIDIALSPKKVVVFNNEKTAALIYSNKVEIVSI